MRRFNKYKNTNNSVITNGENANEEIANEDNKYQKSEFIKSFIKRHCEYEIFTIASINPPGPSAK